MRRECSSLGAGKLESYKKLMSAIASPVYSIHDTNVVTKTPQMNTVKSDPKKSYMSCLRDQNDGGPIRGPLKPTNKMVL